MPSFQGAVSCRIQRRLTAGAACENLRARCLYYYSVASKFCSMCEFSPPGLLVRVAMVHHCAIIRFVCRETADVAVAKAVFSSFRERFTKLAEFALAMSSHSQDKTELIQNLSLEELFRVHPLNRVCKLCATTLCVAIDTSSACSLRGHQRSSLPSTSMVF